MDSNPHPILSSDDSCDSEIRSLKSQLTEFGLEEENLSKEEMNDILKALKNSKESVANDEMLRKDVIDAGPTSKRHLKRRYVNVRDRRMPWSILPPTISQAEKARTLAVYIKLMSLNSYRQARQLEKFASWPVPIQIMEETTRILPLRSTRSGRSVPIYSGFDDDSSDLDFVVAKPKKRKVSNSEVSTNDVQSAKVLSLKRKSSKDENTRPVKETKIDFDSDRIETVTSGNLTLKKDISTMIED